MSVAEGGSNPPSPGNIGYQVVIHENEKTQNDSKKQENVNKEADSSGKKKRYEKNCNKIRLQMFRAI